MVVPVSQIHRGGPGPPVAGAAAGGVPRLFDFEYLKFLRSMK